MTEPSPSTRPGSGWGHRSHGPATLAGPGRTALAVHIAWVFALGIMAGFFATYSANINLATAALDGPAYALIQSSFNRNVRHALFFVFFFGVVPLGLCLLVLSGAERQRRWWWLVALGVVAYLLGIVVFTRAVNLPLNALTESWTPATVPADWAQVRDAWNRANLWRAVLCAGLFVLGLWTLVDRLLPDRPPAGAAPSTPVPGLRR